MLFPCNLVFNSASIHRKKERDKKPTKINSNFRIDIRTYFSLCVRPRTREHLHAKNGNILIKIVVALRSDEKDRESDGKKENDSKMRWQWYEVREM